MVTGLPLTRRSFTSGEPVASGVRRVPPLVDPLPMVTEVARCGPCIVVHPTPLAARAIASRLRKAGLRVALLPDDWALAAAGVDVVVGGRSAVWAPCPGIHNLVVLDEHDEALQDERSPTWHARDVAIERAAQAGAGCVLISPIPTAAALRWAGDRIVDSSVSVAVAGWPFIDVVDRSNEEPWKRSLISSQLIASLRDPGQRVVCVINTVGRARLLACRACRSLQRCTHCDAACRRAAAMLPGEASTPTTWAPSCASASASKPPPQPTSRIRNPAIACCLSRLRWAAIFSTNPASRWGRRRRARASLDGGATR